MNTQKIEGKKLDYSKPALKRIGAIEEITQTRGFWGGNFGMDFGPWKHGHHGHHGWDDTLCS